MRSFVVLFSLLISSSAFASVDAKCEGLVKPADYNEQAQQDFLSNYVALATTFSALHGPIPDEPGHGSLGLELSIIPPLGCDRRMVLNYSKTEDTNKTPVVPRPRVTFTFPAVGPVHLYAGLAYVPPVPVLGTRNVIASTEFGFGIPLNSFQLGLRFHGTLQKTIGDVATAFDDADPAFDDLYLASSLGLEAMAGYELGGWTPYMALGFTDVSTFFFIGDDGVVTNNLHPYAGLNFSVGTAAKLGDRFRLAGELYGAPGGYSLPDKSVESVTPAGRYGKIYTGRFRFSVAL
jgi:hypothetical protein